MNCAISRVWRILQGSKRASAVVFWTTEGPGGLHRAVLVVVWIVGVAEVL